MSQGVTDALILAGVVLIVQQLEGDLVAPLVFCKAVNLHPVAVLTALATGAVVAGAIGAILAVQVAASIASSFTALRRSRIEVAGKGGHTSPQARLRPAVLPPSLPRSTSPLETISRVGRLGQDASRRGLL